MPAPEIVPYVDHDRQAFADLVNEVHAEFGFGFDPVLDADLADPLAHYAHVWILKTGDTVLGSVALTPPIGGTTTLKRLYLRPDLRGRGWGRRLLAVALEAAVRDGCGRIELDTSERQRQACRLYEGVGFQLERRAGSTLHYAKLLERPTSQHR